jgi:hypothetical protein
MEDQDMVVGQSGLGLVLRLLAVTKDGSVDMVPVPALLPCFSSNPMHANAGIIVLENLLPFAKYL